MLRKLRVWVALLITAGMVAIAVPAAASAAPAVIAPTASQVTSTGPTAIALPAGSTVNLGAIRTVDGHSLTVELVNAATGQHITAASRHGASPQIRVGAGWYLYVYLNRGDFHWLLGLGYAAASAALCSILAPTIAGAIACGVVAYIIWSVVESQSPPWNGYCVEIKINWWGGLAGTKWVHRNC